MQKYIDTHCHLNGEFYIGDIEEDIQNAFKAGVTHIIIPGTNEKDSYKAIEIAKKHKNIYAMAGIHPSEAFDAYKAEFLFSIRGDEIIAVGETGIDLFHVGFNPTLDDQIKSFELHIAYALKYDLPIVVHARNAEKQVYGVLSRHQDLKIIMHCYTGSWEYAQKFLDLGAYISISGAATYNKTETINDVIYRTPLDRLIVETDAPFLTPVPHRGKSNKPEYVRDVANYVASVREEDDEIVLEALYNNAKRIFNLD